MVERTVIALKQEDGGERQRIEDAICSFWAPLACKNSDELQEVALQSILALSDQILEIALIADLPVEEIDPMGLKARVVSLKQQARSASTTTNPETNGKVVSPPKSTPTNLTRNDKASSKPKVSTPAERESLFDD